MLQMWPTEGSSSYLASYFSPPLLQAKRTKRSDIDGGITVGIKVEVCFIYPDIKLATLTPKTAGDHLLEKCTVEYNQS